MSALEVIRPINEDRSTVGAFLGTVSLPVFASVKDAIRSEDSNDAVHFLFPEKLIGQANRFLTGFNGTSLYAVKANSHPEVLSALWQAGIRHFDVASIREVEQVRRQLPEASLYFMHPVKSRYAIRRAYALGVRAFSFDHMDELAKISDEIQNTNDLELFLRLDVEVKGAAYDLKGKFGAAIAYAPLLLERALTLTRKVSVSFHVGSQCLDPAAYRNAIAQVVDLATRTKITLNSLSVGGGFPVPYPGMEPAPLETYFDVIHSALADPRLKNVHVMCEPGRALVSEAGAVAARVELRKGNDLYLNDGTYGALFDAGVPAWPFPVSIVTSDNRQVSETMIPYRCFGPTCDSCDKMDGPFHLPTDIREGDWVLFQNLGSYGHAMQTRFNGFYSERLVCISSDIAAPQVGPAVYPLTPKLYG